MIEKLQDDYKKHYMSYYTQCHTPLPLILHVLYIYITTLLHEQTKYITCFITYVCTQILHVYLHGFTCIILMLHVVLHDSLHCILHINLHAYLHTLYVIITCLIT